MKRREFIMGLAGSAALPFAAYTQQKMHRIGVLLVTGPQVMGPYREALRELGYIEGKDIEIEVRSAQGQASRLSELAAELVRSKVDVIVAALTPAVTAAQRATSDIPIVMAPAGDPVGTGLISSLARPGGNITGLSGTSAELYAKTLEVIREVLPATRRVAVLVNAADPFSVPFVQQVEDAGRALGITIQTIRVRGVEEFASSFPAMEQARAAA